MAVLTDGLTKTFGATTAVDDLSLCINEGEVVALVGKRGAGKTTLLRMLAGQLQPTSGTALVAGLDIDSAHQARRIRFTTALIGQQASLDPDMSAAEVFYYFTRLLAILQDERGQFVKTILIILRLWDARLGRVTSQHTPAMWPRLAMARALQHNPRIVFLDEPTLNVTAEEADMVGELISYLSSLHRTLIIATQSPEEAERLCDRVTYLTKREHPVPN